MSLYSVPTLVGSLLALGIAILVLWKDIKSKINIIFALFSLSLFGWMFSFAIGYSAKDEYTAYMWEKIGCVLVDFAGPFLYHFIVVFLKVKKELKIVYATYFLVFIICLLSFSTNFVFLPEPHKYYWGYYPNAGLLHLLAISLHSCIMIRTLTLLYGVIKRRDTSISENYYNQVKYIFWGLIILVVPGLTDYLPKYGLEIYPLGWAFVIMFCFVVAYAIIKHRLMNINIVFRGTLIYSLLAGLITSLFVVTILLLEKLFQGFTGQGSILASAFTAFIIAVSFIPAKNIIQSFVDKYFLKGTAEEIAQENVMLRHELLKQDRMKGVATLAASMAHEIKNPLTVIKTFTEFLSEKYDDKNFKNNFIRLVTPQVERIDFTVQQLLDFAKPSAPDLKPINIYKILSETMELLSGDFVKNKIKAQIQFHDSNIMVLADSNQLKQVFLNLFLNAVDAMPKGGNLTISGQLVEISDRGTLQEHHRDKGMEIRVQDTGHGISKENLKRIFQPFFTTKITGTGLGLSVVHDILEQHNASIKIESEEGKGATFIIQFPRQK